MPAEEALLAVALCPTGSGRKCAQGGDERTARVSAELGLPGSIPSTALGRPGEHLSARTCCPPEKQSCGAPGWAVAGWLTRHCCLSSSSVRPRSGLLPHAICSEVSAGWPVCSPLSSVTQFFALP